MYQSGYEQYKMQSVNTMTRSEMLLLLYDELIKRLTRAQIALDDKNYALFDKSIQGDCTVSEKDAEYGI